MTDQEMILSAAKAVQFRYDPASIGEDGTLMGRYAADPDGPVYVWNPLKDVMDAIVLSIKLKIQIDPQDDRIWAHYGNMHLSKEYDSIKCDSFCRIVTMVASEIGRQYL